MNGKRQPIQIVIIYFENTYTENRGFTQKKSMTADIRRSSVF